ncbi:hypothetical protein AAG906_028042 [Vitis piasezkii]
MGHTSYHQNILPWIIDAGASHHMIGTYECLNDLHDIMPCPVGLPNGAETKALKEGTVTLGEKLKLRHVLMLIGAGEQCKGFIFSRECLLFVLTRQLILCLMSSGIEEWGIPLLGAQQTREVFFSSDNKTKECFDLIHCDLWGAYRVPTSCGATASDSDVEHEIDVEMGYNMEMAIDGNIEVGYEGHRLWQGKRVKQPFVRLKDYVTHTIRVSPQ